MAVVGEADELGGVREAQVGTLERQRDRVDDRVGRHGDHHDRGRGDQPDGEAAFGAGAVGQMAPAARGGGGRRGGDGAGTHRSAAEESEALILLRNELTTVLGLMFEVGDSVFWIASVTSA